ncbi:MAG: 50S ribosome-binding protein YggL [Fuerstiella sp.]
MLLRRGEFREDCFPVEFTMAKALTTLERNALLDRFIDMIETVGLQFGGGGDVHWSGVVEIFGRGTTTTEHRDHVVSWLRQQPGIVSVDAGQLFDAWYGSP